MRRTVDLIIISKKMNIQTFQHITFQLSGQDESINNSRFNAASQTHEQVTELLLLKPLIRLLHVSICELYLWALSVIMTFSAFCGENILINIIKAV